MNANIQSIWKNILGTQSNSVDGDFFELGGNSLLAIRLLSEIKKACGVAIALQDFFENPTLDGILATANEESSAEKKEKNTASPWLTDAQAIPDMRVSTHHTPIKNPRNVLLTGATGFLGSYILKEVLKQSNANVHCLVRGGNNSAKQRVDTILENLGIGHLNSRVIIYEVDISIPNLGLCSEKYQSLTKEITDIYHIASEVNHLYSYNLLNKSNVAPINDLIRLSNSHHLKNIYYISTLNVACTAGNKHNTDEQYLSPPPNTREAYTLTKWVAENKLFKANKTYGIPIKIFRPGNIMGHSVSGKYNFSTNHMMMLVKGCSQLGRLPPWNFPVDVMPVDILSRIIVQETISNNGDNGIQVYNLQNPYVVYFSRFVEALLNKALDVVSTEAWNEKILNLNDSNALYPLKSIYEIEDAGGSIPINQLSCETMDIITDESDKKVLSNPDSLLMLYRGYLNSMNFFDF